MNILKNYGHKDMEKYAIGHEDELLKAIISLDRVMESLYLRKKGNDLEEGDIKLCERQNKENISGIEAFIERLYVICIEFCESDVIKGIEDIRDVIKLTLPVEIGERYFQFLKDNCMKISD